MRTRMFVALAALSVLTGVPASAGPKVDFSDLSVVAVAPAAAGSPAHGFTCGFVAVTDPFVGPDVQTGVLAGGPLNTPGRTVSMECSIQAGGGNSTHSGGDIRTVTSPATVGSTLLAPSPQSYQWPLGQPIWICTQVTVDGVTSYWDAAGGAWSASSGVSCSQAATQEFIPGPGGVMKPVVDTVDATYAVLDTVVCPLLDGPLSPLWPVWVYLWYCNR